MAILECDVGNTRCKWRVLSEEKILRSGQFVHRQGFDDLVLTPKVDRARVVSVASPNVLERLTRRLREAGLKVEIATSNAVACGVVNGYEVPSRLGVDRWLAIIAGYKQVQKPVLIVDAGTALTVDFVDAAGLHLGGYILPGATLMRSSLLSSTEGVRFDMSQREQSLGWGRNTCVAVDAGVLAAQVGVVVVAAYEANRQLGRDFAILLTGGDAEIIKTHLPNDIGHKVELVPGLVLDGLAWVLP